MADLFAAAPPASTPLAERLRPRSLAEVVGQRHLLGPGKPLAVAFHSGKPHSMILWGPPGVGKTTLARLMADAFNAEFIAISAVLSGVKEIRDAVARAELTRARVEAGAIDTVADRVTERVQRSYRTAEEFDHLRAGVIDHAARETLKLRSHDAVLTAEGLVKVDGAQIHLG